ncbi:MAG: GPR endopeptidase [Clostridia bacterium]|nr:GPR endopeptidase [Clostridia bacterium]
MEKYEIRTDLALETRELYKKATHIEDEVPGVQTIVDDSNPNFLITKVQILSEEGANLLGKPIGDYITIESPYMNDEVESIDNELITKIAETIKDVSHIIKKDSVLVVGLGNTDVTPDALGPKVINHLNITRHLAQYAPELLSENTREISAVIPGVLGTTGIETSDIIKGIINETAPDILIVIDALAAKDMNRISRTIQICNTGITPGSGVKNNRSSLTKENLGIPVVAIGVPTVVGIPTIIDEAISYVREKSAEADTVLNEKNYMQDILENKQFDFMVTPNTIDDIISNLARLISEGINEALK